MSFFLNMTNNFNRVKQMLFNMGLLKYDCFIKLESQLKLNFLQSQIWHFLIWVLYYKKSENKASNLVFGDLKR